MRRIAAAVKTGNAGGRFVGFSDEHEIVGKAAEQSAFEFPRRILIE
jgi:hypothetical protein